KRQRRWQQRGKRGQWWRQRQRWRGDGIGESQQRRRLGQRGRIERRPPVGKSATAGGWGGKAGYPRGLRRAARSRRGAGGLAQAPERLVDRPAHGTPAASANRR